MTHMPPAVHSKQSRSIELFHQKRGFHLRVLAKENSTNQSERNIRIRNKQPTLPAPTDPIIQIKSPGSASKTMFFRRNDPS